MDANIRRMNAANAKMGVGVPKLLGEFPSLDFLFHFCSLPKRQNENK
jgi:hypothetical protein